MSDLSKLAVHLPEEQQAIRARCFHPSGSFVEFGKEEVEQSIPRRFEKVVRLYPERVAVKTKDSILTYWKLNERANRIARAILAERGPANEPIALLLDQGSNVSAAILGVLKAGKCFVPIDPSFPQERIQYLLHNSQAGLLVTNDRSRDIAEKLVGKTIASLNLATIGSSLPSGNLALSVSPDNLAALLYTSGSTGEPKGVMQTHRTLLHATMRRTNAFQIRAEDRLMLLASGTYQSIMNILSSSLNGARLCPFNVKQEGATRLVAWLIREEISVYHSSASLFREIIAALRGTEDLTKIRIVRLASEAVTKRDFELFQKHFPSGCLFTNGLGSTETGMMLFYAIDKNTPITTDSVPLGYPLQGMEILLLDDEGKKVGYEQVGEIAVRGRYLSPGYWQRPDLTEAKFRPEPGRRDQRIYFTGDVGRMSEDGCVEHLGRKDFLVKVRGYRVETGDVETKLSGHSGIKEAAVIGRKKESGDNQLVAYIVPAGNDAPRVSELRGFLQGKLPDYMIPSTFVVLDALPRTPNGKVDRNALPVPGRSRPELDVPFAAARTFVERDLAKIWAEVLSLEQVGIHDNFFDLGGHSLAATRVISRIRDAFQVELPLRCLFETPTIAALTDRINRACSSADDRQIISIQPVSRDRELPLSFSQQRLWFLEQLEPGSFAYNFLEGFRLNGYLNVEALERSFNEVVRRHEALRTVYKTMDGQPMPVILASSVIKLRVVDLRKMASDTERESEVQRLAMEERRRSFDLAHGPLLRVTLVWLTETEYVLLRAIHHIAFDGWSVGILAQELSALYNSFSNGEPSPLPELRVQYADFAHWQRERFRDDILTKQLSYWKRQLNGITPVLELPTDRPRPAIQSFNGARQYFVLPEALSEKIQGLSKQHHATLFPMLLAAFQALLHRYTGQNDILIGSPVASRNRSEIEGLIGFFLNMLVLRTDLSGNPTFEELLHRVRDVCMEAYFHQDLPFEKLVEELQPQRDLSRSPMFQVMFAFQNTPRPALELAGLTVRDLEVPGVARYDLHLFMEEENGLQGWVDYNTDLFDNITITRMLGHFQTLLKGIVSNPDRRISDLPILTEAERHQLLIEWNGTKATYSEDKCLHRLFEAQAEQSPNAVAVQFEEQGLTYRELNRRANQLAHYLQTQGVGPGVAVGVFMERSVEMVVGLLGILKAGGAYVPLDPAYPKERLVFMLEDTQATVLLTQAQLAAELPMQNPVVVSLDTDGEILSQQSEANPVRSATARDLAYVIYTSGSTGKPKGVQIPHRALVNFLESMRQQPGLTSQDTVLAVTTLSFDIAALEIFLPLVVGGRVVLASREVASDGVLLSEELTRCGATVMQATPATWQLLVESGWQGSEGLKILCGGEALPRELAEQLLGRCSSLWNMYGPTETTVWSAVCRVEAGEGAVSIGRPIANTQIYILDSNLQPVPVGVPGELYIGGEGLARGYLNRPELTAEEFILNPFSEESTARMYRTGDLARYLPDGNIEFLGRIDHQVKMRGFRIELGEIEAVLADHPSVRQSVAIVREDEPGQRRLVAYVVAKQGFAPTASDLRGFLKDKLPEYMVPSAFVMLDALPLTPNGKVDRKALPEPDHSRPEQETLFVPPATPAEKIIAEIWAQVLKVDRVGVHDDFFDLGGHSLLATQVISRIRYAFRIEVPLRALFENPTVAGLAEQVARVQATKDSPQAMAGILADLEPLSNEEAERLLAEEGE